MGNVGRLCRCQKPLTPMKLLFPIKKKDYTTDVAISKSWDDSRTLYKPQYSFVNLGKSRSVEKYKTTVNKKTAKPFCISIQAMLRA